MKHLRRFNEEIGGVYAQYKDFYDRANSIINYSESDYEQGDEPSNVDILSELGDLCNELEINSDDLKKIINSNFIDDPHQYLNIILEDTIDDENAKKSSIVDKHLLIVHHESGDEIHFTVVNHSILPQIQAIIGDDPRKMDHDKFVNLIQASTIEHLMCQTYVLENYSNISKYNIVEAIYLPELGY